MATDASAPWYGGRLTVTSHAQTRWDQRADTALDVREGWQTAETLVAGYRDSWQGEEYRVHRDAAVVLVRCGDAIVTALDLSGEDAEQWLRSAVYSQFGAVWRDDYGGGR